MSRSMLGDKCLALSLAIVTLVSIPTVASGREPIPQRDWTAVQAVAQGVELSVQLKSGATVKGRLIRVSDTALTLSRKDGPVEMARGDIRRIYLMRGRARGKSALVGAAIGGAIGVGAGLIFYLPARDDIIGLVVPTFGAIGAGLGAAFGALFGGRHKGALIYEAT